MEIADLVYIELLKEFDGSDVSVKYIYDERVFDVSLSDGVIVYYTGERDKWFNIGSGKFWKEQSVMIEVISSERFKYSEIRDKVMSIFDGKSVVQNPAEGVTDISTIVESVDNLSFYLDKVTVSDTTGLVVGERIYYGSDSGWIRWINGNDLYVLKAEGEFVLIRPDRVVDRSDKLKKMWRCSMSVVGQVIPVG